MSYCTPCGFRLLASNYLGITQHNLFDQIEDLIGRVEITPAEVAEQLLKDDNPYVALTGLIELFEMKRKEKEIIRQAQRAKKREGLVAKESEEKKQVDNKETELLAEENESGQLNREVGTTTSCIACGATSPNVSLMSSSLGFAPCGNLHLKLWSNQANATSAVYKPSCILGHDLQPDPSGGSPKQVLETKEFAEWNLKVGNGTLSKPTDGEATIDIDLSFKDTVQLETAVTTISQEYLLEFTSEYGISEALHPELPGLEDMIVDFPESKDGMPAENTYSPEVVMILNTHCTPIRKQQEALICLVGLSRIYYLGDEVYPMFLHDDDRDMDLFSLIRAPNPTKVKTGSRPRAAYEVPLLTVTTNWVIEIEDPAAITYSSVIPSTIERSHLDFANENPSQQSTGLEDQEAVAPELPSPENVTTMRVAPEAGQAERVTATGPHMVKERHKRGHDGVDTNTPPKVLRMDHADPRPTESTRRAKSLAAIELGMGSTLPVPVSQGVPVDVSNLDLLSFADPQSRPSADVAQSSKGAATARDPKSHNTSFTSMVGSPESIYRPEWGITNDCLLDAPKACQDLVDLIAPPRYFSELRHLYNDNFLKQYIVNLARQVAIGSQLSLRFEHEAKLLKKSVAQVVGRDKRIQARENEIKNLETLLEAETDTKKAAKNKSAELSKELESMRALFLDLQVSNDSLSQQVSTLQEQVMGEEKLKSAFEEFKRYEDNRVEQRCVEMDARLDALSIDFDEELYPHMLTAIAGHRWMIRRDFRLAMMKYGESTELRQAFTDVVSAGIAKGMSEGLKHGVEHGKAKLDLEAIEAYDPEAEAKYIAVLYASKNLKYPLVDQLESLKDLPMDVIMAFLHLESDTRDDAPQWIREIPNVSHAEKKKKCRVVCRTHGVSSARHARSDGVPVSVPTVAPQGLAILLANVATQTKTSKDEASPWLLRSLCARTQRLGCMSLKTQSPQPLGLQPVYAAGRL
uniref:AAA-ATPase At3g50940-like n=1 Tax=Tanacetum cinerariifolium TaxID=118510 RepID=A0A6L2L8Q4_TANCI|nr:AAA-ATPase At3g50940-like [Tanacetum cinerariifolium]